MGIHRNLIHPKFGNFVLLGTVLTELEVESHDHPIEYNPCLECKRRGLPGQCHRT
jgi:epoxyqueuosine reductase QueG